LKDALAGSIADLGQLVGKGMVLQAAKAPEKVLAPDRPPVDPGRPLSYLTTGIDQVIADGFGFSLDEVRKNATIVGLPAALASVAVPRVANARFDAAGAARLQDGLSSAVELATAGALPQAGLTGVTSAQPARDALDELLEAAVRAKEEKR
jgi:hypothetical protein